MLRQLGSYLAGVSAQEFFWWSAVPTLLAAAAFVATLAFLKRTRLIEDMPTSKLRSAAQGYVEIEGVGRMMPGEPVVSPLSASRCIWWRYCVEEKQRQHDGGASRSHWVTIDSETSGECFEIDDGTGRCVVDPDGARVIPTVKRRWYGTGPRPNCGPEIGGGFWRAWWCGYRYTEELIFPDTPMYVIGSFRTQMGGPDVFDEQADVRELLAKWKKDKNMMQMLDRDKDGVVSMKEWEAARRAAVQKVRAEHTQRAVDTTSVSILSRPKDRRPFILSGIPQAALVRRYRGYAAACLGGTGLTAGFVLFAMSARGLIG